MRLLATKKRAKSALIVAVSKYAGEKDLPNPTIDAERLEATLKGLGGWTVIMAQDQTLEKVWKTIRDFVAEVRRSKGDCLVAFSGHGIQVNGRNYFFTADSQLGAEKRTHEEDAKLACLPFHDVQDAFKNAGEGAKVFLVDCCRSGLTRGVDSGVASTPLQNSLVIFSTASGKDAFDGVAGEGGLFAKKLCEEIGRSGAEDVGVYVVMDRTRTQLAKTPELCQLASNISTLLNGFYFGQQEAEGDEEGGEEGGAA
ncbi:hypothetical protein T484DRAFT_3576114 [Baffinella frigidus]|nr:hypothetical protein T484DRAFT_3576114 [Cryptophyta sp. CCMP2293]